MDELLLKFPTNSSLNELVNLNVEPVNTTILKNAYNYNNNFTRKKPKLTKEEYIAGSIKTLESCIDAILDGRNTQKSYDEYYHLVENSCKNGNYVILYNMIKKKINEFWNAELLPTILNTMKKDNAVSTFIASWSNWKGKLNKLKLIFLYLENTYLIYSKSKPRIHELGCQIFCRSLVRSNEANLGSRLYEPNELKTRYMIFEDFVRLSRDFLRYRTGGDEIKTFVEIIGELDVDQSIKFPNLVPDLIAKVLEDLEMNWIIRDEGEVNVNYLHDVVIEIDQLAGFFKAYFQDHESYSDSAYYHMTKILIFDQLDSIYENLLPKLLFDDVDQVHSLYMEFIRWDHDLNTFSEAYSKILQSKINSFFQDDSTDDLVVRILRFKDQCSANLVTIFNNDESFEMKLRDSLKKSINNRFNLKTVVDKLNKYIDQNVKAQDRDSIARFQEIFKFIEDKNLFKDSYSLQLSRRLIFSKTELELESYIVELMSVISGPDFTKSLEIMVQDVADSVQKSKDYFVTDNLMYEFKALTLNSIPWQNLKKRQEASNVKFKLPAQFESTLQNYEIYWSNITSNNKLKSLKWFYNLNQLTLERVFKTEKKQIFVNLLQGCILLLFNDFDSLSLAQIRDLLQIPRDQDVVLTSHLNSLSKARHKLLICNGSQYHINENFKSKSNVVKPTVNTAQTPSAISNSGGTNTSNGSNIGIAGTIQSVEQEDKLRSIIVRVMKRDRQLAHTSLVNQVSGIAQITDTRVLKPVIEKLIYEEFIQRVSTDLYEYIP